MAATNAQWRALARSLLATLATLVITGLLLACYYNAPLPMDQSESNSARVITALTIFAVFVGFEIWRIGVSRCPQLLVGTIGI